MFTVNVYFFYSSFITFLFLFSFFFISKVNTIFSFFWFCINQVLFSFFNQCLSYFVIILLPLFLLCARKVLSSFLSFSIAFHFLFPPPFPQAHIGSRHNFLIKTNSHPHRTKGGPYLKWYFFFKTPMSSAISEIFWKLPLSAKISLLFYIHLFTSLLAYKSKTSTKIEKHEKMTHKLNPKTITTLKQEKQALLL